MCKISSGSVTSPLAGCLVRDRFRLRPLGLRRRGDGRASGGAGAPTARACHPSATQRGLWRQGGSGPSQGKGETDGVRAPRNTPREQTCAPLPSALRLCSTGARTGAGGRRQGPQKEFGAQCHDLGAKGAGGLKQPSINRRRHIWKARESGKKNGRGADAVFRQRYKKKGA